MSTKKRILARDVLREILGQVSFAQMIHAHRLLLEHSQVHMAELLGITKQDLCNIEKGRKLVSVERAMHFAKALSIPPAVFAKYALQDQLTKAGLKGEVEIKKVA